MNARTCITLIAAVGALSIACTAAPAEESSSDSAEVKARQGAEFASSAGELKTRVTVRSVNDFDIVVTREGAPYVTITRGAVERMYGLSVAELSTPEGRAAAAIEAGRKDAAGIPAMARVNQTFFGAAKQMGVRSPLGKELLRFIAKTSPIRTSDEKGGGQSGGLSAQDANDNCHLITSGVSLAGGIACSIFTVGVGAVLCFGGTIAFDVISYYGCNHFYPPNQGGNAGGPPNGDMTPAQVCTALGDMNNEANADLDDVEEFIKVCRTEKAPPAPPPAP